MHHGSKIERIAVTITLVAIMLILNQPTFQTKADVPTEPHPASSMWIDPSPIRLSVEIHDVGFRFNVTVWTNVSSVPSPSQVLTAWQFVLSYDRSMLNATRCGYTAGGKSQFFSDITTVPVNPTFGVLDALHDFVMHGESWSSGPKRTVPSFGSLGWIEFEVISKPSDGNAYESPIELVTDGVRVCKILDDELGKASFNASDGDYRFGKYDVAVTGLSSSKMIVCQGYAMNFTVTGSNFGSFRDSFNVAIYSNNTLMLQPNQTGYVGFSLPNGSSSEVNLTWDTNATGTPTAKGNYTIKACAWPVNGEVNTVNNNLTNGLVRVSMVGDITGSDGWPDDKVDVRDVANVARLFGKNYFDPGYNPNCDINNDGKIDVWDVAMVARHFGEHYP